MRRGVKPLPTHLKVVNGTFRADRDVVQDENRPPKGRPKHLKGRAAKIWDEKLAEHPEWTEQQLEILETWCQLKAEVEKGVDQMPTPRIVEFRRQTEFLLAPRGKIDDAKKQDPSARYF